MQEEEFASELEISVISLGFTISFFLYLQTTELSTTHVQTNPVKSFPTRKNDDIPCDASSYLKHILEG